MPNEYNLNALTEQRRLQNLGVLPNAIGYRELLPYIQEANKSMGDTPIGSSKYDTIQSLSDIENIENIRASNQSSALKLLNGLGKMTTTAATTFVSGTLGSLYGLGKGLYNLADGDGNTGFRDGLWDNSIVSAMQSIQDKMESVLPNYYSTAERENAWYSNIFTANFWGDKFLKNAGFTIGAMATMAVPGFKNFFGIGKGIANIGKAFTSTTKGLQMAEKAGKVAMRVGNTLVSAAGEANIEAYNGAKAFMDTQENNINRAYDEAIQNINDEFDQNIANGMGYAQAKQIYDQKINNIENEKRDLLTQAKQHATDVGNSIFTLNMGILSASNNIQFSRLLEGGWRNSKHLLGKEGVKMVIDNAETKSAKEFGKALASGTAKFVGESKPLAGNMVLKTATNMLSEGNEELMQNLAAGTSQAVHTAGLNKYKKSKGSKDGYSLYASSIDPNATEEYTAWTKALGKVWQDEFGKASAGGWEEFVLGALTGGLGTVSVRKKNNGKVGLSWQGGFYEAYKDIQTENAENQLKSEILNKAISTTEFRDKTRHATAAISIAENMRESLVNNDILAFKNHEMLSLVNDALYFKKLGLIDSYRSYYEEIAKGISEEDVENLKLLTSKTYEDASTETKKNVESYLSGLSNDQIKNIYTNKAKSTLNKIDEILKIYDNEYANRFETFLKATEGNQALAETMLQEVVGYDSLIKDLERRKTQVIQEKGENSAEVQDIEDAVQAVRKEKNLLYNNPDKWFDKQIKTELKKQRIKNIKEAENVKDLYYNANTIQEVAEIYANSNSDNKNKVLEEVIKNAPENKKELFKSFIKFSKQAKALNQAVIKAISNPNVSEDFKISLIDEESDSYNPKYIGLLSYFSGSVLDDILNDISNDEDYKGDLDLSDEIERRWRTVYKNVFNTDEIPSDFEKIFDNIVKNLKDEEFIIKHQEAIKQAVDNVSVEEENEEKDENENENKNKEEEKKDDNNDDKRGIKKVSVKPEKSTEENIGKKVSKEEAEKAKEGKEEEVENEENDNYSTEQKEQEVLEDSNTEDNENEPYQINEPEKKEIKKIQKVNTKAVYIKYDRNGKPYTHRYIVDELKNKHNVDLDKAVNIALRDLVLKIGLEKVKDLEVSYITFTDAINNQTRNPYIYLAIESSIFEKNGIDYKNIAGQGDYIYSDNGESFAIIGCMQENSTNKAQLKEILKSFSKKFNENEESTVHVLDDLSTSIAIDLNDTVNSGLNTGNIHETVEVYDLKEILANENNTLKIEDIHFATIVTKKDGRSFYIDAIEGTNVVNNRGKEVKIGTKTIAFLTNNNAQTGSVFMLLPGIDGKYHIAKTLEKTRLQDISKDSNIYIGIKSALQAIYNYYIENNTQFTKKEKFKEFARYVSKLPSLFYTENINFFNYDKSTKSLNIGSTPVYFDENFVENALDALEKSSINLKIRKEDLSDITAVTNYLNAGMFKVRTDHAFFDNAIFYVKNLNSDTISKKDIVPRQVQNRKTVETKERTIALNGNANKYVYTETLLENEYSDSYWYNQTTQQMVTDPELLKSLNGALLVSMKRDNVKDVKKGKETIRLVCLDEGNREFKAFKKISNDNYEEVTVTNSMIRQYYGKEKVVGGVVVKDVATKNKKKNDNKKEEKPLIPIVVKNGEKEEQVEQSDNNNVSDKVLERKKNKKNRRALLNKGIVLNDSEVLSLEQKAAIKGQVDEQTINDDNECF